VIVPPGPTDIRGRVADLAGRLGIAVPDIAAGNLPAWSAGVVLTLRADPMAGLLRAGRPAPFLLPGAPLLVLSVDPARLAGLPGDVQQAMLAHPLAQLALDQPRRRKKRVTLAAVLASGSAIAALEALSWPPLLAWAGMAALGVLAAVLADLAAIRGFLYEADRRVADVVGPAAARTLLDHLQHPVRARPAGLRGWAGVAARALPSPARRARRLSRDAGRGGGPR
jgi:hypothetical protein